VKIPKPRLDRNSLIRLILVMVAFLGMYVWGYLGIIYSISALFSFILLGVKDKRSKMIVVKKYRQACFINTTYKMIEYIFGIQHLREELKIDGQVFNLHKKTLYLLILLIALPLLVFLVLRRRYSSDCAGAFIIILLCMAIWANNYYGWRSVKEHYSYVSMSGRLILVPND
jgi:hypothetical protein